MKRTTIWASLSIALATISCQFLGLQISHAQTIFLNHAHQVNYSTSFNPSLSLLNTNGSAAFVGRQQWVGIDGAPVSYLGNAHIGIEKIGATAGLFVRQDRFGVTKKNEASVFFAKSIRLSEKNFIGLSLNAGIVNFKENNSSLDGMDAAFRDDQNETDALIGLGIVFYNPDLYYVGVSLPRITNGGVGTFGDSRYNFENQYYLNAGYLWAMNESLHLRPSAVLSYASTTGVQFDAGAMVFAKSMFGVGVGVKSEGDLSGMLRFNFSGLGVGYSYQVNPRNQPLNRQINNSTHEIGLSYNFGGKVSLL